MRSTIDINEQLLKEAMALSKARTKKEVIHQSLQCLIQSIHRKNLRDKFGSMNINLTLEELEQWRAMD
jgi:Arc/MetJ family transcription regulator